MGEGRTYASAALYPGLLVKSSSEVGVVEDIDCGEIVFWIFFASIIISLPKLGRPWEARELVEAEKGSGEEGKGLSSSETMERSSPFHWSPRVWVF